MPPPGAGVKGPQPASNKFQVDGTAELAKALYGTSTKLQPLPPAPFTSTGIPAPLDFAQKLPTFEYLDEPVPFPGGDSVPPKTHVSIDVPISPTTEDDLPPIFIQTTSGKTETVKVEEPEARCNVYWIFFILGLVLLPLLPCGALGLCSNKKSERIAGKASAMALSVVFVVAFVAIVSAA